MPRPPSQEERYHDTLLPELRALGRVAHRDAKRLGEHRHRGLIEICLIEAGRVDWWRGDELYSVGAGEVTVTPPDVPHGGQHAVMQPCTLCYLQVPARGRDPLPAMPPRDARSLLRRLGTLERRSFTASPTLRADVDRLLAEQREPNRFAARSYARATLHRLLIGCIRDHDAAARRSSQISPPIDKALRWLQAQLHQAPTIEAAIARSGLGPSRFFERFRAEVGLSPQRWLDERRIALAKTRLRSGHESITAIALDLGYASSQHFASTCKRLTGLTPSAYRQLASNE